MAHTFLNATRAARLAHPFANRLQDLHVRLLLSTTPSPPPSAAAPIQSFFRALTNDMDAFMVAASIFCLVFAAFLYMFAGENERRLQAAKLWLFAAGVGLAIALLAPTIGGLINSAAGGGGQ